MKYIHLLYTLTYYLSLGPLKLYDLLHGTEFSRIEKTGDHDGRFEYYPSSLFSFPFLGSYIRRQMRGGRGHSVLDIGCGKGFVLLFFSGFCFDRVSGLEYDEKLCRLARNNLKSVPKTVSVYWGDAADYSEYENYDTFYLYNPFDRKILEKCLDLILASLKQRPRKLTVFYCNPVYGDVLKQRGFKKEGQFYYKTTVFVFDGDKMRNE